MWWLLAHGAHWALVVLGVTGSGLLLLPSRVAALSRLARRPPRSSHEERVQQLRTAVESGRLGQVSPTRSPKSSRLSSDPGRPGELWSEVRTMTASSSLSAAVIHAAISPHHLREQGVVGAWDLAANVWELSVVAGCLLLLRRPPAERRGPVVHVGQMSWLWAGLSATLLMLITLLVPHE